MDGNRTGGGKERSYKRVPSFAGGDHRSDWGGTAFLLSPIYVAALEGAIEGVENLGTSIGEALEGEELEAVELVFGADPAAADVLTALESLLTTGDVLATLILGAFILGWGPLVGILVSVPAIRSGRGDGRVRELLDRGYSTRDVVHRDDDRVRHDEARGGVGCQHRRAARLLAPDGRHSDALLVRIRHRRRDGWPPDYRTWK